jgi:uncharacterized protein YukE
MATSVLDIDVNSQEFEAFLKSFQKYQAELEQMPPEWKQVNAILTQATSGVTANVSKMAKGLKTTTKEVSAFEAAWKKVADTTKGINKTLKETGSFINRLIPGLGGITLGVGALIGLPAAGLGLFTGLQEWASKSRTKDLGIGVSQGERTAFNNTYSTYGLDESTLSHVASMKNDPSQFGNLQYALQRPVTKEELDNLDPAKYIQEVLQKIHDAPNRIQAQREGSAIGLGAEQVNNIRARSNEELRQDAEEYARRTRSFEVQDKELKAAQDFTRSLDDMGNTIKATVFEDLKPLQGPLKELLDEVNGMIKDFLGSDWLKSRVSDLGDELKKFADYLKSPEFQDDVNHVLDDFRVFGAALSGLAQKLHDWFGIGPDPSARNKPADTNAPKPATTTEKIGAALASGDTNQAAAFPDQSDRAAAADARNAKLLKNAGSAISNVAHGAVTTSPIATWWNGTAYPALKNYFTDNGRYGQHGVVPDAPSDLAAKEKDLSAADSALGFNVGTLDRQWWVESKRGKKTLGPETKYGQAKGDFQFVDDTAKEYNVNVHDWKSEVDGLKRKMAHLVSYYKGDQQKAFAAYNWGEGNVDRDVRKYGNDWLQHAPQETQKYVRVILENRTGNDISTISGNMTAY